VASTLFFVCGQTNGYELWKSDGTAAGTVLVKDIYPGGDSSWPSSLTEAGGHVFFTADDGVHGDELWTSWDGTTPARSS
jgi:ELWxxDGT repeat protein